MIKKLTILFMLMAMQNSIVFAYDYSYSTNIILSPAYMALPCNIYNPLIRPTTHTPTKKNKYKICVENKGGEACEVRRFK